MEPNDVKPSYEDLLAFAQQMARLQTLEDKFEDCPDSYEDAEDMRADLSDDFLLEEFGAFESMILTARDLFEVKS